MGTTTQRAGLHRRLLLDLCHLGPDPRALSMVVDLAGLLGLDLQGVFVEDEAVRCLAGLPFARELRLPVHEWSPLAMARIEGEVQDAADRLRRVLHGQAASRGIPNRVDVVCGDPADAVAALSGEADILVLGAPDSAALRALGTFPRALRAAMSTGAAVLLLPPHIAYHAGPVTVLTANGGEQKLALAARIARAAGEKLLVFRSSHPAAEAAVDVAAIARVAGLAEDQLVVQDVGDISAGALQRRLAAAGGRLLALDRPAADDAGAQAAASLPRLLRIPVLLQ